VKSSRLAVLAIVASSVAGVTVIQAIAPETRLVWNRTPSAPIGFYLIEHRLPPLNGWALLSAKSGTGKWIAAHGFLADGWPIIKRVRGVAGDEICRDSRRIYVNSALVAEAFEQANPAIKLPRWSGCRMLRRGEFFLLNDHPRSLDGRYFGVTQAEEIDGTAILLWKISR
jgi:type IV secretory pathway protease TraF